MGFFLFLISKVIVLKIIHSAEDDLWRQRSGGSRFKASPGKQFRRHYHENTQHKKGLVE
jgi:hypothetical protein